GGRMGVERRSGRAAGGQAERRNLCPASSTGRARRKTNSATSARPTSAGRNAVAEVVAAAVAAADGEVAEAAAGRPGGGPGRHRTGGAGDSENASRLGSPGRYGKAPGAAVRQGLV